MHPVKPSHSLSQVSRAKKWRRSRQILIYPLFRSEKTFCSGACFHGFAASDVTGATKTTA